MAGVHDLDDVKLDLDSPPQSSIAAKTSSHQATTQSRARLNPGKVNAKLEYHLAIAKTAKGASAVKLIGDVLSSNGVFVFGEILNAPGVAELATHPVHSPHYRLLEIFAFGTWKDYRDNAPSLPQLNAAQATKLKQLSIVTRAAHSRVIPYSDLLVSLEIPTIQELEELIIDATYCSILEAKLDQKYQQVEMESCIGRDVKLVSSTALNGKEIDMDDPSGAEGADSGTVLELRTKLKNWTDSVGGVLDQLDQYIDSIRQKDTITAEFEARHTELVRHVIQSLPSSGNKDRKSVQKETFVSQSNAMIVDDSEGIGMASKTRKRTRA